MKAYTYVRRHWRVLYAVNQRINNDIFHKNDNVIVKQDKELHSTETNTEEYRIEFKRVPKS